MAKRVILDSNAASPLRISVPGVDADNVAFAQFDNLIFDGNQSPLRLWGVGFSFVVGISYDDFFLAGKNTEEGSPTPVAGSPAGTTPIFFCAVARIGGGGSLTTPYCGPLGNDGAGGAICRSGGNNVFIPVDFWVGPPTNSGVKTAGFYVNYCVFKNYQ